MQKQSKTQHKHRANPKATARRKKGSVRPMVTRNRKGISHLVTYKLWKAVIDRTLAFLVLVALSPFLGLIALGIRLDSSGNPLLRQERIGKDGRRFTLYKFRSMYTNHDDTKYQEYLRDYIQASASGQLSEDGEDIYELIKDPRVTRFGALLRKTNLDELPQFINILKGDMSLVGPRPDIPFAVSMYKKRHWNRFQTTPGLTGLWQITERKKVTFEEMVRLDLEYIKKQSLLLDIKIMLLTIRTILRGDGS